MSRYRKIDPRVWNDGKFRSLTSAQQLTWFYLLSGPDTNRIGLYQFSFQRCAEDLQMSIRATRRNVTRISDLGMMLLDGDARLVWIPKWLHYNEPSGANQILSLQDEAKEFLPHPFAQCLLILIKVRLSACGQDPAPITKKQAILIRDGIRCAYCQAPLAWDTFELDHVMPQSRESGDGYDQLVASCKQCHGKKGARSAEEFGFPFVRGTDYSLLDAMLELVYNAEIRVAFSKACNGLPDCLRGINELAPYFRRAYGVWTPSERRLYSGTGAGTGAGSNGTNEKEAGVKKPLPRKRCPEDFEITADMRKWAAAETPGLDIDREAAKFKDYEFAKPRTDWLATWRNWMRTAAERSGNGAGSRGGEQQHAGQQQAARVGGGSGQAGQRKPFEGAPAYIVGGGKR